MLITRKSPISGNEATMDLPISQKQIDLYDKGEYIQVAFANLNPDQREFYMTGITPDEWNKLFPKEEEDDES
jgi:hypothetical protein